MARGNVTEMLPPSGLDAGASVVSARHSDTSDRADPVRPGPETAEEAGPSGSREPDGVRLHSKIEAAVVTGLELLEPRWPREVRRADAPIPSRIIGPVDLGRVCNPAK